MCVCVCFVCEWVIRNINLNKISTTISINSIETFSMFGVRERREFSEKTILQGKRFDLGL